MYRVMVVSTFLSTNRPSPSPAPGSRPVASRTTRIPSIALPGLLPLAAIAHNTMKYTIGPTSSTIIDRDMPPGNPPSTAA